MIKNLKILFYGLLLLCITLFFIEGIYTIAKNTDSHQSLIYQIYSNIRIDQKSDSYDIKHTDILYSEDVLKKLIIDIDSSEGFVGNIDLDHDFKMKLNSPNHNCVRHKNNLSMNSYFIKTNLNNNLDPITIWLNKTKSKSIELDNFLNQYSNGKSNFNTNNQGFRIVDSTINNDRPLNIFTGGGTALSAMISDNLTIPYLLQQSDPNSKYLNFSVSSSEKNIILCNLNDKLSEYDADINNLILLMSDIDLINLQSEDINLFLKELDIIKSKYNIKKIIIIYFPYIYTVSPEISVNLDSKSSIIYFPEADFKKELLLNKSSFYEFDTIDFSENIYKNLIEEGSLMNVFDYYLHQGHPSYKSNYSIVEILKTKIAP